MEELEGGDIPEIELPWNSGNDEEDIRGMFQNIGDMQLDRAFTDFTGSIQPSGAIAARLLRSADLLLALDRTTEATDLIQLFENMGVTENEEYADAFAAYRMVRLSLLKNKEDTADPIFIAPIVAEHKQSKYQSVPD